jgi:Uma2 family endonuclease
MPTILDLPEVRPRVVRWTVQEYESLAEQGLLPKQAELLRGLVIEKMPKFPLHRALSKRLYDLFQKALPAGFVVFQEAPLRLRDSEPEPDVAIVRGLEQEFQACHPATAELVVEVAVSSADLDRANASLYAEAGVPEYWIVLGRERQVEVFRLPIEGVYREHRFLSSNETLVCAVVPGIAVVLRDLFA